MLIGDDDARTGHVRMTIRLLRVFDYVCANVIDLGTSSSENIRINGCCYSSGVCTGRDMLESTEWKLGEHRVRKCQLANTGQERRKCIINDHSHHIHRITEECDYTPRREMC